MFVLMCVYLLQPLPKLLIIPLFPLIVARHDIACALVPGKRTSSNTV